MFYSPGTWECSWRRTRTHGIVWSVCRCSSLQSSFVNFFIFLFVSYKQNENTILKYFRVHFSLLFFISLSYYQISLKIIKYFLKIYFCLKSSEICAELISEKRTSLPDYDLTFLFFVRLTFLTYFHWNRSHFDFDWFKACFIVFIYLLYIFFLLFSLTDILTTITSQYALHQHHHHIMTCWNIFNFNTFSLTVNIYFILQGLLSTAWNF